MQKYRGDGVEIDADALMRELMRAHIAFGVRGVDALLDAIHEDMARLGFDPEVYSRDYISDRIPGYGDLRKTSREEDDVIYADMRAQMRLLDQIRDIGNGVPPKKSGAEPIPPTQEQRRLRRVRDELMKRAGVGKTKAEQLKSRLASMKTAMENKIEDIEEAIACGRPIDAAVHDPIELDDEAKSLKERLDGLKDAYREIFSSGRTQADQFAAYKLRLEERLREARTRAFRELYGEDARETVFGGICRMVISPDSRSGASGSRSSV